MMKTTITTLQRKHLTQSTSLLAEAFREDPLMRGLFTDAPLDYDECLSALFRFACEVRLLMDWPLLGCWTETQELVGVAGLDLPDGGEWPPELEQVYRSMGARIGPAAVQRLERYSELADTGRPEVPHLKVGMIGVSPEHQGKGYGLVLMHAVHSFAKEYPGAEGIWLDTENPRNLPWYQHLGYEIRAKHTMEEISIWGMYNQFDRDHTAEE